MLPVKNIPEECIPYLTPTATIDSDHPLIREYAWQVAGEVNDPVERSIKLYLAVRDGIRYDPYLPFHLHEHYQASKVLERGRGFCIPKASLLCALARACEIPCRLGFANVKNHLATRQLLEYLGTDLFSYHAYVELYLDGRWVKATPAFNRELCERHKVAPLEFNGREDSLFQPYNEENRRYMEYTDFIGTYVDVPVAEIIGAWEIVYGRERVRDWILMSDEKNDRDTRKFDQEDVFTE